MLQNSRPKLKHVAPIVSREVLDDSPLEPAPAGPFHPSPPAPHPSINKVDNLWVETKLGELNLKDKLGQLIVSSRPMQGESEIGEYHVGGFVFLGNGQRAEQIRDTTNRLQHLSTNPLWFSIDAEAGLGARVADATAFPLLMALGATNYPNLAREMGGITAAECRALGVHVAFGPVVDVNTEPRNPIISTRSLSDDPEKVIILARNLIRGAHGGGILTALKHFPGHGCCSTDSHNVLPQISMSIGDFERVHLRPFRELIESGDMEMVMTAHVWLSEIDREAPLPATLSKQVMTGILREKMGFDGVILSDAFNMAGIELLNLDEGEVGVRAIEAGLDCLVAPHDTGRVHDALLTAVESGRLSTTRIDESVRRILRAKSRLGLHGVHRKDEESWKQVLRHPIHLETVREVSSRAVTEICYRPETKPFLTRDDSVVMIILKASQMIFYRHPMTILEARIGDRIPNLQLINTSKVVTPDEKEQVFSAINQADKVLIVGYDWTRINDESQVALVNDLLAMPGRPEVAYVGFGAPYHLYQIPDVDVFYCGYATTPAMQEVVADVLLGKLPARGELPVQLD